MHRSALLNLNVVEVALNHLRSQRAADVVQHRLFPVKRFRAAVLASRPAVSAPLGNDLFDLQAKRVCHIAADDPHELSQVWCKTITGAAPLHACINGRLQLLVSER